MRFCVPLVLCQRKRQHRDVHGAHELTLGCAVLYLYGKTLYQQRKEAREVFGVVGANVLTVESTVLREVDAAREKTQAEEESFGACAPRGLARGLCRPKL